jgi:hypothetical protein
MEQVCCAQKQACVRYRIAQAKDRMEDPQKLDHSYPAPIPEI